MYSKSSWGGADDPFILVRFNKPANVPNNTDPLVSLVIFEWGNHNRIGRELSSPYEVSEEKRIVLAWSTRLIPLSVNISAMNRL